MASAQILAFPRSMKRGRKVTRGPVAELVALPVPSANRSQEDDPFKDFCEAILRNRVESRRRKS